MRDAIHADQLALHFQAQINQTGHVLGAEVLLRWQHPLHGNVPPAQFIPIAEATGLILPIGEWVLQQACAQLYAWAGQPRTQHLELAVNVSARQFRRTDFVAHVVRTLQQSGAPPTRLVLELTESLVIHDVADTAAKMQALRHHGVRFALDDFGTGHALQDLDCQVFQGFLFGRPTPLDQFEHWLAQAPTLYPLSSTAAAAADHLRELS